jgi:hypothetical protein
MTQVNPLTRQANYLMNLEKVIHRFNAHLWITLHNYTTRARARIHHNAHNVKPIKIYESFVIYRRVA